MRIVWSDLAKNQLREIYSYYKEIADTKVAQSIKRKITKKTRLLISQPEMGQREENPVVADRNFRYLIEGNYKIVYKVIPEEKEILIAVIFDTRQDPTKMKI